jgi:DNA-binding transcriptional ArsR family regulator
MPVVKQKRFAYHQSMNVDAQPDASVSKIAATIGEPSRARMLFCLVDGRARTSTELAMLADVSPSTASSHLKRLMTEKLVRVSAQGKHRYYSLQGSTVARALEALSVLAGESDRQFVTRTPNGLRFARTCYDHIAGILGVSLHDRLMELGWLSAASEGNGCEVTEIGTKAIEALGIDVTAMRLLRRRFAYLCVDWSERRPHLGGAFGAALLKVALTRKWVAQDLDSRALSVTSVGRREMRVRFGLHI